MPIPGDGFASDDAEMDQQSRSEGSYQGSRGSKAGLVNLRDRDVERCKWRYLVQILEGGRQSTLL